MGNHNDNKGELTTKKGEIDNQISLNILPSDEINGTTLSSRLVCRARWTYVNLREPRSMSPKLEAISQPVEYLTRQTSWRMKVVLGYIFTFSLLSACRSLKDCACPSNVCLHLSFLVKNRRESLLRSLDFSRSEGIPNWEEAIALRALNGIHGWIPLVPKSLSVKFTCWSHVSWAGYRIILSELAWASTMQCSH